MKQALLLEEGEGSGQLECGPPSVGIQAGPRPVLTERRTEGSAADRLTKGRLHGRSSPRRLEWEEPRPAVPAPPGWLLPDVPHLGLFQVTRISPPNTQSALGAPSLRAPPHPAHLWGQEETVNSKLLPGHSVPQPGPFLLADCIPPARFICGSPSPQYLRMGACLEMRSLKGGLR